MVKLITILFAAFTLSASAQFAFPPGRQNAGGASSAVVAPVPDIAWWLNGNVLDVHTATNFFDNSTGTAWSGTNNGTFTVTNLWNPAGFGITNSSGTSRYAKTSNNVVWLGGTNRITMMMWVKTGAENAANGNQTFINDGDIANATGRYSLILPTSDSRRHGSPSAKTRLDWA